MPESKWPVQEAPRIELLVSSCSSEETELSQLRLVLGEREQEVVGLKVRIAELEAALEENRVHSLPLPEPTEVKTKDRALAHTESRGAGMNDIDLPLRRIAVTYRADSVPPAVVPSMLRQSERQRCEMQIEFAEESQFYAGLTQDISEGGVFIATYHLRPIGMRLDLSFVMPDGVEIQAAGVVRWLRDSATEGLRPGMGVAFTDLKPESAESINRYCRARAPLYMDF